MPPPRITAPTINGTIGMPPVVGRSIIIYTRMPNVEAPRIPPVRTGHGGPGCAHLYRPSLSRTRLLASTAAASTAAWAISSLCRSAL